MPAAKRITLVTGATGFLGLSLCNRLQQEGEYVRACGRGKKDGPWQEFVQLDLRNKESIPDSLFENVTTVFHLASIAHTRAVSETDVDRIIVEGTKLMVKKAEIAGIDRFIYFSSVKSMGEGNPPGLPLVPIDENWPHAPSGPYGCAKSKAESVISASTIEHKVILRPVMVYGKGQKGNLPRMIRAIERGRFPPVPDNRNRRSMIHIDDVVEYAIRSAQFPIARGKCYILASNIPVSTRFLYDTIRKSLGMPHQDWDIPMWMLKGVATMGTIIGTVIRKPMPFDLDTFDKLTGSAWYSSELVQQDLRYQPAHEIEHWLLKK